MMIRIKYPDNRFDMVKASRLDHLLDTNQVSSFKRESGWVVVGRDPVRGQSRHVTYPIVERRDVAEGELSQKMNLSMNLLAEEAEAL